MPTPQQTANLAYKTSLDLTELKEAFEEFKKICATYAKYKITETADPKLYREKLDSQALLIRLGAKYLVLFYIQGYRQDRYDMLQSFLKAGVEQAEAGGFIKTGELCKNLQTYIRTIHEIALRAIAIVSDIRDVDGRLIEPSPEKLGETKATFEKTIEELRETLGDVSPFPEDVRMPSIKEDLLRNFKEEIDWIDRQLYALLRANAEVFIKQNATPLSEVEGLPRTVLAPTPISMDSMPTLVSLSTPFPSEAIFAVRSYGENVNKTFYLMSSQVFFKGDEAETAELFRLLKTPGMHLLLTDVDKVAENKRAFFYEQLLRFASKDNLVFLVDTVGDRKVYDDLSRLADTLKGVDAFTVDYTFLKMPPYADVVNTFDNSHLVPEMTDAVRERIRRNLPFMGYVGLSACVAEHNKGNDPFACGEHLSETNRPTALRYLSRLVASYQFIDNEWGDYSEGITHIVGEKKAFDYDVIRTVNPENVRIILQKPGLTLFERCALATKYCTLGGDDMSIWVDLPAEEKQIRMQEASRVLCSLLNTEYSPRVEVLDEDVWKERGYHDRCAGFCSGGGKLIVYRHRSVKDYDFALHIIFHECFHAFQHAAMVQPYAQWYFDELGVTRGRIDKWSMNEACYHEFPITSIGYRVEIMECDANAFADDCQLYAKSRWHELELV